MKRMMEGVVLEGTGRKAILNGYSIAGKTGTAQKIDPATGRYSKSHYIASFTGFAPVNNPALVVLVILDSPVGPHEGGQVSAPVFARVAQQVLAYWNVPHDIEVQDPKKFVLRAKAKEVDVTEGSEQRIVAEAEQPNATHEPSLPGPTPGNAENHAAPLPTAAASSNRGQPPAPVSPSSSADSMPTKGTIVLDTAGGVVVPDFSGKPLRAALEQAENMGIEMEITGSGVAESQSPPAGSRIPHGGHVSVRFGR
jgi:cell division protein FtsI (penicillin-binding protein 3)